MKQIKLEVLIPVGILVFACGTYVAGVAGDLRWLPISEYKTEKLYDLQDEVSDLEAKEKYEGGLTQREAERLKRLILRTQRLQQEIN